MTTTPFMFCIHVDDSHLHEEKSFIEVSITTRRGRGADTYYLFKRVFRIRASYAEFRVKSRVIESLKAKMEEAAKDPSWTPNPEYWSRVEIIDESAPAQSHDDMPW